MMTQQSSGKISIESHRPFLEDWLPFRLNVLLFFRLDEWLLPGDIGDCPFLRVIWLFRQLPKGLLNSTSSYSVSPWKQRGLGVQGVALVLSSKPFSLSIDRRDSLFNFFTFWVLGRIVSSPYDSWQWFGLSVRGEVAPASCSLLPIAEISPQLPALKSRDRLFCAFFRWATEPCGNGLMTLRSAILLIIPSRFLVSRCRSTVEELVSFWDSLTSLWLSSSLRTRSSKYWRTCSEGGSGEAARSFCSFLVFRVRCFRRRQQLCVMAQCSSRKSTHPQKSLSTRLWTAGRISCTVWAKGRYCCSTSSVASNF